MIFFFLPSAEVWGTFSLQSWQIASTGTMIPLLNCPIFKAKFELSRVFHKPVTGSDLDYAVAQFTLQTEWNPALGDVTQTDHTLSQVLAPPFVLVPFQTSGRSDKVSAVSEAKTWHFSRGL